ncbi:ORF74-like protein [Bufonid herpesvirus 1]|uniref:ORF74-like protein n=1 Tax=Bufonid herpesvirus 1 TaxID=2282206 RepID=UPI000EB6665B|nr:ORF74-like protein [Bufonid herpesvirus 1]AXF48558.1 ORF74-like protein [Bufonid herpesvirus 1]
MERFSSMFQQIGLDPGKNQFQSPGKEIIEKTHIVLCTATEGDDTDLSYVYTCMVETPDIDAAVYLHNVSVECAEVKSHIPFFVSLNNKPIMKPVVLLSRDITVPESLKALAMDPTKAVVAHGLVNKQVSEPTDILDFCEAIRYRNSIVAGSLQHLHEMQEKALKFSCRCQNCGPCSQFSTTVSENFVSLQVFHGVDGETSSRVLDMNEEQKKQFFAENTIMPGNPGAVALVAASVSETDQLYDQLCKDTFSDITNDNQRGLSIVGLGELICDYPCIVQHRNIVSSSKSFPYRKMQAQSPASTNNVRFEWILSKRALRNFTKKIEQLESTSQGLIYCNGKDLKLDIVSNRRLPPNNNFIVTLRLKLFQGRTFHQLQHEIEDMCGNTSTILSFPINEEDTPIEELDSINKTI